VERSLKSLVFAIGLALQIPAALAADLVAAAEESVSLKTFVAAVEAAGLTETLKNTGPYTVFAPVDSAFQHLPAGELDALLKDKAKLAEVLSYHIIPGEIPVTDVKPGEAKTIQGKPLKLTSDNGMVTVNEANVIQSDVEADNGIIHEIDKVIRLPQ
jgi:uncharacterized surface protein with fasciclin (FAS1) repeats